MATSFRSPEVERESGPPERPRALLIAMIVFVVLIAAYIVYYTIGTQRTEPTGAEQPAPYRLEESPTSPEGEALPPNVPGDAAGEGRGTTL
jgi:hypothetical protein